MESLVEKLLTRRAELNQRWLANSLEADAYLTENLNKFVAEISAAYINPTFWKIRDKWTFEYFITFPGCSQLALLDWPRIFKKVKQKLVEHDAEFNGLIGAHVGETGHVFLVKEVNWERLTPLEEIVAARVSLKLIQEQVKNTYEKLLNSFNWQFSKEELNPQPFFEAQIYGDYTQEERRDFVSQLAGRAAPFQVSCRENSSGFVVKVSAVFDENIFRHNENAKFHNLKL